MTSPIIQINFAEEEREAEELHAERQFMCRSDGSDLSSMLDEEKSDLPAPPPPSKAGSNNNNASELNKSGLRFPSPQKKVTDACRTVYGELRKNLNRRSKGEAAAEKKQKPSFLRGLVDMSGLIDEENERSLSNGSRPSGKNLKGEKAPPPVALRKPTEDSDEDIIPLAKAARVGNPQPQQYLDITQNEAPSMVPPPSYPPEDDDVIRPPTLMVKKPSSSSTGPVAMPVNNAQLKKKASSGQSFNENLRGNMNKPSIDESDDGLEPHAETASVPSAPAFNNGEGTFMSNRSSAYYTDSQQQQLAETFEGEGDEENGSYSVRNPGWLHSKLDDTLYGKIAAIKWSCTQVSEFLEACGLGMYARTFAENGVDGSTLLELSHDQIRRGLNIQERLHLLSLELGVEALRQRKIKTVKDWEWSCPRVSEWLEAKGLGMLVNPFKLGAVHGGVLFSLTEDQFVAELGVGRDSVLILMSLLASIERAREVGPLKHGEDVPDWSPNRVKTWLESLSLAHLVPVFKQFAVNGALLLHLDAHCMRQEMNVTEIQAIVLEKAIVKLRKHQVKHASLWMTTWKRISQTLRGRKHGNRKHRTGSFKNVATATTSATTAKSPSSSATSLSASLAATYDKYATHGQALQHQQQPSSSTSNHRHHHHGKHHHHHGKHHHHHNAKRSQEQTPQKAMVTQQPVSPTPSRPPRPSETKTASKPASIARQNTQRLAAANKVEESTMSIL